MPRLWIGAAFDPQSAPNLAATEIVPSDDVIKELEGVATKA
jgi:hypothetical protein